MGAPGERPPAAPAPARGAACFRLDSDGFSCCRVLDAPEVWRVELLMGDTFLPSVNAFVVLDAGEALVVDAGTADDYNDTRLMRALLRLGVDPARMPVTLFCTHAHNDHMGLARELSLAGARVTVSEGVASDMRRFAVPAYRGAMVRRLASEGMGAAEAAELADAIWDHVVSLTAQGVPFSTVAPGDVVRCGRWAFEVVPLPGHTPGQCGLWEPRTRTAFLGDAVLYLCSTFISFVDGEDPVGEQLETLGHGLQQGPLAERCLANAAHHERRAARALAAIRQAPGQTGFELVSAMGWHAPVGRWAELPALTRWFLASESAAHLDHLVATGAALRRRDAGGTCRYWPR